MLSDEEKKAIDELKEGIKKPLEVPEDKFDTFILYNIESAKTILNLIEKQSKEIEELETQDKAIDLLVQQVVFYSEKFDNKFKYENEVKKYFIKKVEE